MNGRGRIAIYVLLFFMVVINYVDRVVLSVAAPAIAKEYGFGPVQMGYLFSSYVWTYLVCLIPMGIIADRWGGRIVGALSMFIWSVACALTGAVPSYAGIFACRLALGAAESASVPVGGRVIRNWVPKAERGLAGSMFSGGTYAGLAFGSLLVSWLVGTFGWRGAFYVAGGIGVIGSIVWYAVYTLPENARWLSQSERDYILNEREAVVAPSEQTESIRPMLALKHLLSSRSMIALALAQGCAGYSLYLFLSWLPSYLAQSRGLDLAKLGILSSIPYVVTAIFGIYFSSVVDRVAKANVDRVRVRRLAIVICLFLSSIVLAAPFVGEIWVLMTVFSISFTCIAIAFANTLALTSDLLKDSRYAGMATAILITGGNIFGIAAPIITGYLVAGSGGFTAAFMIAGVLLLMGAICILSANRPIEAGASA